MRVKRVEKFKRKRRKTGRNLLFFAVFLPCIAVLMGYVLTSIVILPMMKK